MPAKALMPGMSDLLSMGGALLSVGALFVLALAYVLSLWEARREGESGADTQIGLKLVLYTLMVVALGVAAGGLNSVLFYLVSGAKASTSTLKSGLASIIAGGGVLVAMQLLILPRTNAASHTRSSRYFLGYVAAVTGIVTISALSSFVSSIVDWSSWARLAAPLSGVIVYGGLSFLSLSRFGALSGWAAPARMAKPGGQQQAVYAQQQAAYAQQQQAYAQQQQAYQQQQQAYPGQQQAYPGQQQAYPGQQQPYPQQGQPQPYPQQGQPQPGGGLPPPGGYNPQGGGYQR